MSPRIVHSAASLVIVLVAYWTYSLLAVPLIEPPAGPRTEHPEGDGPGPGPPPSLAKDLEKLFPPGSWELQEPKALASDQAILLIEKYDNLGDGWVDLFPLAVLFLPDDPNMELSERIQRATVLEAPEGARVRFDRPLSLSRLQIGQLVEGRLRGPVTIRNRGKRPDHRDDLLVTTSNVELSQERVWTPEPVDFHWGPTFGRGRQMEIKLRPREGTTGKQRSGPNVGGIEQFEVQFLDRLHLEQPPPLAGESPRAERPGESPRTAVRGVSGAGNRPGMAGPGGASPAWPIEITCRGPFRFDAVRQVATFQDQVEVLRIRPSGPNDRVGADLLSVLFTPSEKAGARPAAGAPAATAKTRSTGFDLEPRRIIAQGRPATVAAPADKVFAEGERIEYDLKTGAVSVEHAREAVLQQGANEIRARSLRYEPAEPGRLGQAWAKGPGWFRGMLTNRTGYAAEPAGHPAEEPAGQPVEAHWLDQLEIHPEGQYQHVSLTGGAGIKSQSTGKLDAREIHFWLSELPASDGRGQSRLQPDRMLAQGEVKIDSPQLSGSTERLEITFTPALPAAMRPGAVAGPMGPPPPATPGMAPATPGGQAPGAGPGATQHIDVQGRLIQARMLLGDQQQPQQQQAQLTTLAVDGNVCLRQTQTSQPGEQPLLVTGSRLDVTDANLPSAQAIVTGSPAHFEARGLNLTGSNIHFHRGENRVWIDGEGWMLVPMDRDLEGRPLANAVPVRIDWRRLMEFDGKVAHFEDQVVGTGPTEQWHTDKMYVSFQKRVVFTEPNPREPPQMEQVACLGGVLFENRTFQAGQPVSYDRMKVPDLVVNMISGDLKSGGPGWLIDVRRGSPGIAKPQAVRPTAADPSQLTCLHLRYLGSITGNIRSKQTTFHDQVRAAYAPVPAQAWLATLESDDPAVLGPRSVVLHSDHLTVTDMGPGSPAGAAGGGHSEMTAFGNVVAEGCALGPNGKLRNYTARATRMSYAQAKDMAVLEGDGRTDAQLFIQEGEGTVPTRLDGQKILYRPGADGGSIDGARSLELNQAPDGRWNKGTKLNTMPMNGKR
ncbi:MAG: hypothetical protein ABR915_03765 [Thermoguttaceae bacterium]